MVAQVARLLGTSAGMILRIKVEGYLLTLEVCKTNRLAVLGGARESRGFVTFFELIFGLSEHDEIIADC